MKTTAFLPALGLATLLAGTTARAQSDADASVPTQPASDTTGTTIRLTPPAPDGGIYGAGPTAAPPAPTATVDVGTPQPAATPVAEAPSVVLPPPPPPAVLTMPDAYGLQPRHISLTRQRLRLLDSMLPPLAERSRSQRILDGVIALVLGTGIGTVGFFVPSSPIDLRPYFWVAGGLELVSGVVTLAWVPARETLTSRFMAMPMNTAADRRNRVHYGEWALNEMAADGARRRVINSIEGAVVPLALLGIFYAPVIGTPGYTPEWPDYLIFGLTGVEVIAALIPLFGRSEEERMRQSYFAQLRLLQAEQGAPVGP